MAGEVSEELLADLEDDEAEPEASSSSRPAAVSRPQMRKCRTNVEWLILRRRFSCKHESVDINGHWKIVNHKFLPLMPTKLMAR